MKPTLRTKVAQNEFLAAYERLHGNVAASAASIGLTADDHRNWLKRHPEYRERYEKAKARARRARRRIISNTIFERGTKGRKVYLMDSRGRRYAQPYDAESDTFLAEDDERVVADPEKYPLRTAYTYEPDHKLLMAEAKRLIPGYRDKQHVSLTGKDGGPIETRRAEDMSDDELRRIASQGRIGVN